MILTANKGELQVFGKSRDRFPDPRPNTSGGCGLCRPPTVQEIGGDVPENIRVLVIHTTAGDGFIPVDIVMQRKNSSPGKGARIDLYASRLLGAGNFGRVFHCDAFVDNIFVGGSVAKIAHARSGFLFDPEETAYDALRCLYDNTIPHFYGHFTEGGDLEGDR